MKNEKITLKHLVLMLVALLGTTALAISQESPDIIWQVRADKYNLDHSTVEWLRSERYSVFVDTAATKKYFDKVLTEQDIAEINAAKLIIISVNANSNDHKADEVGIGMAQVTTPVLCQSSNVMRASKMNFIDSEKRGATSRQIFMTGIDPRLLQDDNVIIETNAIDSIVPGVNANYTLLADTTEYGGVIFAEFEAGIASYNDGGYVPGSKWVYFGPKGQKNGEISLTDKGKELYLNLIDYLTGNTSNPENEDIIPDLIYQTDNYSSDSITIEWLRSQHLSVLVDTTKIYRDKELSQQAIYELNAAKLIIISRETNSADFRTTEVGIGLEQVTTPVLCQNAFVVRSSRMKFLNSTNLVEGARGDSIYFSGIDPGLLNVTGNVLIDTANWTYIIPEGTENYTLLANTTADGGVLIAEFEAGVETYPDGYTPGGNWVFFAPKGTENGEISFTEEGKELYLNLVKYMMGTMDIIFQTDNYTNDSTTIAWLRSNNYSVLVDTTKMYRDKELSQQEIDELNAADMIIISRATNSADFRTTEVGLGMAQVTTPVLCQNAFVARNSRMMLFNSTALLEGVPGDSTYFVNIDDQLLLQDSVLIDMNNFTSIVPEGTENYTLLADVMDNGGVLIAEFIGGKETYSGGFTPGGNWVLFAPSGTKDNEISLTEAGKELYLNLLTYMITPPEAEALPAPENLTATVDLKDVTLVWAPVPAASAYNVYRDDALVGESITEVTFTDMDLEDALYTYIVRAVDSEGVESSEESVVRAEVLTAPVTPALLFINVTANNVRLSWPPAIRAVAYNVYRGEDKIAEAITGVSYTDEGLENGTYTYSVTSINVFDVESAAVTREATVDYDPTNIEELAETGISIYPNPATDFLNLSIDVEKPVAFRLYNIQGQMVYSADVTQNMTIDLHQAGIGQGFYLYSIETDNQSVVGKIMVIK